MLHDIGVSVDYDDHHKHSRYLILNAGLPGWTQREIALVAQMARYHRKGSPGLDDLAPLGAQGRPRARRRAARRSCGSPSSSSAAATSSSAPRTSAIADGTVELRLEGGDDLSLARWAAQRETDLFERTFVARSPSSENRGSVPPFVGIDLVVKYAFLAYVAAILLVGGVVTALTAPKHEEEEKKAEQAKLAAERAKQPPAEMTPAEQVAARVEEIRGLQFDQGAPPIEMAPATKIQEQLTTLDTEAKSQLKGDEIQREQALETATSTVLAQAGALEAQQATEASKQFAEPGAIAVYVPKERKVLVAKEVGDSDWQLAELAYVHQLTRALESERFGETARLPRPFHDKDAAAIALHEGTAALVAGEYAQQHLEQSDQTESVAIVRSDGATAELPPALQSLTDFAPTDGAAFAEALHATGGWDAIDAAHREEPASTREILHPEARGEAAVPPPTPSLETALGEGWQAQAKADLGELDTIALLRAGVDEEQAREAAEGWRAGHLEVWKKGQDNASALVWRWDTPAEGQEFARAVRTALEDGADARPEGGRGWKAEEGRRCADPRRPLHRTRLRHEPAHRGPPGERGARRLSSPATRQRVRSAAARLALSVRAADARPMSAVRVRQWLVLACLGLLLVVKAQQPGPIFALGSTAKGFPEDVTVTASPAPNIYADNPELRVLQLLSSMNVMWERAFRAAGDEYERPRVEARKHPTAEGCGAGVRAGPGSTARAASGSSSTSPTSSCCAPPRATKGQMTCSGTSSRTRSATTSRRSAASRSCGRSRRCGAPSSTRSAWRASGAARRAGRCRRCGATAPTATTARSASSASGSRRGTAAGGRPTATPSGRGTSRPTARPATARRSTASRPPRRPRSPRPPPRPRRAGRRTGRGSCR